MTFSSNLKMLPIAALMVAAFGTSASAAETEWAKTETHTPELRNAVPGVMMKAGERMHIAVSLRLRNKEELDRLTADLIAGRSKRVLSHEEFTARYAPTHERVEAVIRHLQRSGFTNIKVAKNRMMITADGSAGASKAAFKVDLQHVRVTDHFAGGSREREAYVNVNEPVVPKELANDVLSVHGMQTVTRAHLNFVKSKTMASNGSATGHSPNEWPTIYGGGSMSPASNTTIGIITAGSMTQTQSDLQTFVQQAGFSMPATSVVGGNGSSTSGTTEWDLDSQDSLGAAGGAVKSMIFYAAASMSDADLNADYNQVVSDNKAKVINVSLGECENDAKSSGTEATDDQIFESAVAQGQTFVVSSGDSGSYECGGSSSAQSYPAVSPYVIAVGGTEVSTDSNDAWAGETAWSCSGPSDCPQKASGGGGGGPSLTESAPSWQISSKVLGSSKMRGVPDIAFSGSPASGANIIINGNVSSSPVGGTSLATPIFVGFWARIQSAHSNSLAFPASAIYQYGPANQSTIFHDITSGKNGGYSAKAGWDYVTGFGSLNVDSFANFVNSHSGF